MKKILQSINGSKTFLFRTRCKFCRTGPKYFYFILNEGNIPSDVFFMQTVYPYTEQYFSHALSTHAFSASNIFNPVISNKKLVPPGMKYKQNNDKFTAVVECNCGKTSWHFVHSTREHVKNKSCRYNIKVNDISALFRLMI